MHDSMCKGTVEEKAQAVRRAIAYDFEFHSIPYCAEDKKSRALLPPKDVSAETDHLTGKLFPQGISESDIELLFQILNPDPTQRWTAEDIAQCEYLDFN